MRKIKIAFLTLIILSIFIMPFAEALADSSSGIVPCGKTSSKGDACKLCDLIVGFKNLFDLGKNLLISFALAGIFLAGVMYIISSGDEKMMSSAKSFLKASISGFIIVLTAWFLVNVTLWLISAKLPDLGVGAQGWNKFTCQ